VDKARARVAGLLGCKPGEVVFTSGGSEANNHALKRVLFAAGRRNVHIITTQVEHPAVINPCRFLEGRGVKLTYLPVDGYGRVDPDDVRRALEPSTVLISVMHANNEVGTLQPIAEIARTVRGSGILLHNELRRFWEYNSKRAGVAVVLADPRNSSRECSMCHDVSKSDRPNQSIFRCRACGHQTHADLNAAANLRERGWEGGL
jgi:hypothetical protein